MSSKVDQELAGVFAALGDATRLALVTRLLVAGALSATALAEGQAISRQAIVKRQGREVLYSLDAGQIDAARAFLDAISAGWDRALQRLKTLVETD